MDFLSRGKDVEASILYWHIDTRIMIDADSTLRMILFYYIEVDYMSMMLRHVTTIMPFRLSCFGNPCCGTSMMPLLHASALRAGVPSFHVCTVILS